MTICMTNGGVYDNVRSINDCNVSNFSHESLIEMLEHDTSIYITLNSGKTAILRISCISSINYF